MATYPHRLYPVGTDSFQTKVFPIWGHAVRMLKLGGAWDPSKPVEIPRKKNGAPRSLNARIHPYHSGEFLYEPDPAVSSMSKTGTLVRRMLLARWDFVQIHTALTDLTHVGGQYFRWMENRESWLEEKVFHHPLEPVHYKDPSEGSNQCNDSEPTSAMTLPGEVASGFVILPGVVSRILAFITAEPRTWNDLIRRGPVAREGSALHYVEYMEQMGLLHFRTERLTRLEGKRRVTRTVRLAVPGSVFDAEVQMRLEKFLEDTQLDEVTA